VPGALEPAPDPVLEAALPSASPGDLSKLRVAGGESTALVAPATGAFINAGEFNAWLGTHPLGITAEEPAGARRQALEQMVTFKLLVEHARKAGYEQKLGSASEPKALALAYLRDQMSNLSLVSDEAARRHEAEHPERFAQLRADVPPEILVMAIKTSVRGEQVWEQVQGWMKDAGIRYVDPPAH
jgi:hypothetical protein